MKSSLEFLGESFRFPPSRLAANATTHDDSVAPLFNHTILRTDEVTMAASLFDRHNPGELILSLHVRRVTTCPPYALFGW